MCDECGWEAAIEEMEEMLNDESLSFAESTTRGIYEWVEENKHITVGQQTAIDNIQEESRE